MNDMFTDVINFLNNNFYPLFVIIQNMQLPALAAGWFQGVLVVFAVLAFFNDPVIFPVWFSFTLNMFLATLVISWIMSFIRWLAEVVPIW